MTSWLSVDFGTSNTTAVIGRDGRLPEVLHLQEQDSMPSAVLWLPDGPVVGRSAVQQYVASPAAYVRSPKRLVGSASGGTLLDGAFVPVVSLIAAVLRLVHQRAAEFLGGAEPDVLFLTHPAAWTGDQTDVLVQAAASAGFHRSPPVLVPEPVAAAQQYAVDVPDDVPVGGAVAVFDFGGGTCDVAVLQRTAERAWRVLQTDGDNRLGGDDLDGLLMDWTLEELRARGAHELVRVLLDEAGRYEQLVLRDQVRAAKEALSDGSTAVLFARGADRTETVVVTRPQYEELIAPFVQRAVDLMTVVIERAGLRPSVIDATGGSSRTPSVQEALTRATGIRLATFGDPKLVVARGAALTTTERVRPLLPPPFDPLRKWKRAGPTIQPPPYVPPEQRAQVLSRGRLPPPDVRLRREGPPPEGLRRPGPPPVRPTASDLPVDDLRPVPDGGELVLERNANAYLGPGGLNGVWVGGRFTLTTTTVGFAPSGLSRVVSGATGTCLIPLREIESMVLEHGTVTDIITITGRSERMRFRCFGAQEVAGRIEWFRTRASD